MAKYTYTIYELKVNNFDFMMENYEIFDENYRKILNESILNYFMFREIGFKNPIEWRFRFITLLDRLMREKYNILFKEKQREFNPIYNIDITETFTQESENVKNNENERTRTDSIENKNTVNSKQETEGTTDSERNIENSIEGSENSSNEITRKEDIASGDTYSGSDKTTDKKTISSESLNKASEFPDQSFNEIGYDTENDFLSNAQKNKLQENTENVNTVEKGTKTLHTENNDFTNKEKLSTVNGQTENGSEKNNVSEKTSTVNESDSLNNINNESVENLNSSENENGTLKYEKKTLGSSAGLPFSKAMIQFKQYVEQFQLEKQLCNDLEVMFMQVF